MARRKTIVGDVDADVLRFTVGKDRELDVRLAEADCIGTAAHVTMLAALKRRPAIITAAQRKAVITALVGIMRSVRSGSFRIKDDDQDVHLAVERMLTRELGDLGKRVHTARSRNDQVAVDLRIYARDQLCELAVEVAALCEALLAFASRHRDVPMVGRTHLQPAMPSSVGLWASAHAEGLLEDAVPLRAAMDINDVCPLGSAAGYGVGFTLDRALTAELLGFRSAHRNVLHSSNARGKCEFVILSALSNVMLTLSRLAEDLILYSMPEFSYFSLPPGFCTGSSIMPQKKNPDALELIRARTSRVLGLAASAAGTVKGLPSGYSRDLQETKEPLIEGLDCARASLRIMASLVGYLEVDRKALVAGFSPGVFAVDEALDMVSRGVPFRDAYDRVKANIEKLALRDPVAETRRRNRNAGLMDVASLRSDARFLRSEMAGRRGRFERKIRNLLGVRYPSLDKGGNS
jgi:argininosuccinate lyase